MQSRLTTTTSAFIPAGQVILHRAFEKKNLHGARTVKSAVRHDLVRATCAPRRHHPPSRLESSASSQAPNHRTRTSRRAETSIQSKPTPRDGTRGRLLALAPPSRRRRAATLWAFACLPRILAESKAKLLQPILPGLPDSLVSAPNLLPWSGSSPRPPPPPPLPPRRPGSACPAGPLSSPPGASPPRHGPGCGYSRRGPPRRSRWRRRCATRASRRQRRRRRGATSWRRPLGPCGSCSGVCSRR